MKKKPRSYEEIKLEYAVKVLSDRYSLLEEKISDLNFITETMEKFPEFLENDGILVLQKMLKNRALQFQEEQEFIKNLAFHIK